MDDKGRVSRGPGGLLQALRAAAPEDRRQKLTGFLREQIAERLGLDPLELSSRDNLMASGVDSLKAVELKILLEAQLDLQLPTSLLFDHPNIEALGNALLTAVGLAPAPTNPSSQVPKELHGTTEQVAPGGRKTLSVEELAELLSAEMDDVNLLLGKSEK